jgi:hypothetical protein
MLVIIWHLLADPEARFVDLQPDPSATILSRLRRELWPAGSPFILD